MTFTTRPTLQGTFGMVSSTHWLASQSAMGDARARRQRVRRGGGRRLRPARRRAAPQRPGRRGAGHRRDRRRTRRRGAVRPGPGAGRRDHRALPLARARPGPRLRAARRRRARRRRRLAAAAARPRHLHAGATCSSRRSATPRDGHPLLAAGRRDGRGACRSCSSEHWPTSAALWLRGRQAPRRREPVHQPGVRRARCERLVDEGRAAGADREAQIDAARRAWSEGFVAEAVDAFSRRPFRDSSGEAHAGLVTGEDLAAFSATWEEPATYRLARLHGRQDRAVGPGPGAAADLAMLDALDDPAVLDPSTARRHPRASPRCSSSPSPTARPGTATAADVPLDDAALPGVRRGAGRR